jgi:DNA-binding transcriptional MerR regulator
MRLCEGKTMEEYTLDDLSMRTGFDRRVIRSFIEQGLLRGPQTLGRYARYSPAHLIRLLAIKALKENKGMQLTEIRQALMVMTDDEQLTLAGQYYGEQPVVAAEPVNSALDYIRSIRSSPQGVSLTAEESLAAFIVATVEKQQNNSGGVNSPIPGNTPIDHLVDELGKLVDSSKMRKQARGESWYRISVTPDIELSVRGIRDQEHLARLERVADCLREILMKGVKS